MPADTLLTHSSANGLPIQHSLRLMRAQLPAGVHDSTGFLLSVGLLVSLATVPFLLNWIWRQYRQHRAYKAADASLQVNYSQFDEWLAAYNGYYQTLTTPLRKRFLERVARFTATKTIECINLPYDDKMPLLVGAAAVQISFGLDKYLLDFFDTIYIMQGNYNYGSYENPFEGHVSSQGIYLSWDNFLKGFANYNDADNVGLHEMAHALAYVNFMAGANSSQDDAFIKRFYTFSAVARPIFNDMQQGRSTMLNAYAATNYNEFWAVAVETFFERSLHMKVSLPELYHAMCSLLQQDPLTEEKLVSDA